MLSLQLPCSLLTRWPAPLLTRWPAPRAAGMANFLFSQGFISGASYTGLLSKCDLKNTGERLCVGVQLVQVP